ncbi:MAG: BspA family leucine-rich repeat surface protein, partial [Bacteroidaceae bacterium]|nr:BspA family leucine-rich repeat surface protein [Bacteroidaceae bacterium]
MKKLIKKLFVLTVLVVMGAARMWSAEAYAVHTRVETSEGRHYGLVFYYDNNRSEHENATGGRVFSLNSGNEEPAWVVSTNWFNANDISFVRFDPSFANYRPTTTARWFQRLYGLTTLEGTQYFNTSEVTDMSYMFFATFFDALDLSWMDVSNVTSMKGMFAGSRIQSLDLTGWNTSKVTDMSHMFEQCNLISLNLTFNTSSVTDMSYMFHLCDELTSLTFGGSWSTGNVVNMEWMFSSCEKLTTLDLTSWNVGKVENMDCLFWQCESLTTLSGVRYWNTSSVTNMGSMFRECESLSALDLSGWNTSNVTRMDLMFYGCSMLESITWGGNWNTSNVTDMDYMFYGCGLLPQNVLNNAASWDVDNVTRMDFMFGSCKKLTSLNLSGWNTAQVTTMRGLFAGCDNLTSVSGLNTWNTANLTNMAGMFNGCSKLTSVGGLASLNTGAVTDMSNLFKGCYVLQGVSDLRAWDTSNVTSMESMFESCNSLHSLDLSGWDNQELTTVENMFLHCNNLQTLDLSGWNNPKLTTIAYMFNGNIGLTTLNLSQFDTSNVTNMSYAFGECGMLTNLDLTGWNTSNVTKAKGVFYNCRRLTSLDLTGWDTSNMTDIAWMFNGCNNLQSVDLSGWNTSNLSDLAYVFTYCRSLTVLDLTGWDTSNVTNMNGLFRDCSKLTSIYVGAGWNTSAVKESAMMFKGCTALVGGLGTEYDESHVGVAWANVDAPDNAGYLSTVPYVVYADGTLTFYCDGNRDAHAEEATYYLPMGSDIPGWLAHNADITQAVIDPSFANARPTSTFAWFAEMQNLTDITGLEYLNTDRVTTMSDMFYMCKSLTELNLNNFNTSKVTSMSQMFSDCSNLEHLGLSGFDTSSLTLASNMFARCSKLTTICVGAGWNLPSDAVSSGMFLGCSSLKGGNGTTYDTNHVDGSYAHIDTSGNPGYLCDQSQLDVYVVFDPSTSTLTFRSDARRASYGANTFDLNEGSNNPAWYANRKAVYHVVFDYTFKTAYPSTGFSWFRGMTNLTDISGIENLRTDSITSMESMFASCSKLTTLDLTGWNTSKVQNMENMFNGCSQLTTILVGTGWNTSRVTSSLDMFEGCTSLVGGNGTAYDENHTDKEYACLYGGTPIPSYLTDNLPKEPYAIYSNGTLTFCYDGLKDLRPQGITVYDLNVGGDSPAWMAHNADITQVVIDPSFANARPVSTYGWFDSMSQLTGITGLQYLYTDDVINMGSMFNACTGLTTLDLGSFNTANVEVMSDMFNGCSALTTIYVGTGWSTAAVTASNGMFVGCTQLAGAAGTQFAPDNTDASFALVDGINDNEGYLSYLAYATVTYAYGSGGTIYTYLRFFYDGKQAEHGLTEPIYPLPTGTEEPEWLERAGEFTNVTFDASFRNVHPTSTYHWCYGMTQLTTIDVEYLNASEVTNMSGMFEGCTSLTSFSSKAWDTSKVTDMSNMFKDCSSLTKVYLDVVDVSKVTNMSGMFQGCSALVALSLELFSTGSVTNMSNMFNGCSALTNISIADGWNTNRVTSSSSMFFGCTSLKGSNGTTYNASHTDKAYAHADGGTSNPGYLSYLTVVPYAAYDESTGTLTFYCDSWRTTHADTYLVDSDNPTWNTIHPTHVVFDPSFDVVRPTSTYMWFASMPNLEDITGLEYLHTDNVTSMEQMFNGCRVLESLDLSHFNTSNVTSMKSMFKFCYKLTTLDVSSWDTHNVTDMSDMFYSCYDLTAIYADDGWNTDKVSSSSGMFIYCSKLIGELGTEWSNGNPTDKTYARIDQGSYGPGYLRYPTRAYAVFTEADNTLTIYYNSYFHQMEGNGTMYTVEPSGTSALAWAERSGDIAHVAIHNVSPLLTSTHMWFANMTNLEDITGLEVLSAADVTDMSYMFYNCPKLKTIDSEKLNTSKVTDMNHMFAGCTTLTSLDLSNFFTGQVTDMSSMFQGCNNLKTIYVSSAWSTESLIGTTSDNMFDGCTRLEGENGTKYAAGHTDMEYARLDRPTDGNPGYLTSKLEGYAWVDNAESTLVFVCDDQRLSREVETFGLPVESWDNPGWIQYKTQITHVVFDPSFANARPAFTRMWFYGFENLEDIVGLQYLCTDSVRNMNDMFYDCSKLESLDLSHFNTGMLEEATYMFSGCSNLKSLNVSNWDTKNVTNVGGMFRNCSSIEAIDLSAWNTQNLRSASSMFEGCTSLKVVDLSNWNANHNIGNFNDMFANCTELTTIYATTDWYTEGLSFNVFSNCTKLVGDAGTTYTGQDTRGVEYAILDGGTSHPGFFSNPSNREAYASYVEATNTLTFYYDTMRGTHTEGTTYAASNTGSTQPWSSVKADIVHVVFNSSFAFARPKSTREWFSSMTNLTDITGISYLRTDEVTDMYGMFNGCSKLTSLDLSHFNTSKVTGMTNMFRSCTALTDLDVSGFNTENVTHMNYMFWECKALTNLDVSHFNTGNVLGMYEMFRGCSALTSLNLVNWNTGNVKDMSGMFYVCINLETLNVSGWNTANVTSMGSMFSGCQKLAAIDVSGFNTQNVTSTAGMFQNCKALTTLDVSGFNTAKVSNMRYMFSNCSGLTSLDVSGFITTNVGDMNMMFGNCTGLTTLDVSGWDTGKVYDMSGVFNNCLSLETLDVSGWNTSSATRFSSMFGGCSNLTTLDVSGWNTEKVEELGSMFKSCTKLETLDLSSWNTRLVTKMGQMFYNCGKLTTIYVGSGWNTDAVTTSTDMFNYCSSLVGGAGTAYNSSNPQDKTYAHIDTPSNPGYLADASLREAYASYVEATNTLTFYYDTMRGTHTEGTTYAASNTGSTQP